MLGGLSRAVRLLAPLAGLALLAACGTATPRNPSPAPLPIAQAAPYGLQGPGLRYWGDALDEAERRLVDEGWPGFARRRWARDIRAGRPLTHDILVLSGGGPDGAFGAGLLNGWSARGDRPAFDMVTGVSTGAILALFAFLGEDFDDEMTQVYTSFSTRDLLAPAIFSALGGGAALTDASNFRALIEQYVDDAVVARLAESYAQGRILLIGTTNLDVARPVVWNVTGIAASGHPDARRLIHDVIQASSAIPGAFPPVLIPVETAAGAVFDELHVDGGATQQLMLFSPEISLSRIERRMGLSVDRTVHVVVNNALRKPYAPVELRIAAIAGRASSSLIGGSGSGDLYKVFAIATRDGMDLRVVGIPSDFEEVASEPFDPEYMRELYELGYDYGEAGDRWRDAPPGYRP